MVLDGVWVLSACVSHCTPSCFLLLDGASAFPRVFSPFVSHCALLVSLCWVVCPPSRGPGLPLIVSHCFPSFRLHLYRVWVGGLEAWEIRVMCKIDGKLLIFCLRVCISFVFCLSNLACLIYLLCIYLSVCLPVCLSNTSNLSICLSICLSIYLPIYRSIYLMHLTYLYICLSVCLSI